MRQLLAAGRKEKKGLAAASLCKLDGEGMGILLAQGRGPEGISLEGQTGNEGYDGSSGVEAMRGPRPDTCTMPQCSLSKVTRSK
jgi:hypothetical protein